ncbi:MAG: redoxin domain-containing protein [Candidatus Kapabacteria bacterium]|nr:redoxin domain-containing protein [Candidatus Kapabacteria bacterium]
MKHIVFLVMIVCTVSGFAQTATISGRVMDGNGKPLTKANVSITKMGRVKPDTTLPVSAEGGYSVTLSKPGLWILQFTGVNHKMLELPFLLDKNAREELTVQLEANAVPSRIDSVVMVGKFNNFNTNGGITMKYKDGAYHAEAPQGVEEFEYQIVVFGTPRNETTPPCINGTKQEWFEYDGKGQYKSIINTTKNRDIAFDIAALPKSKHPVTFTFKNPALQRAAEVFHGMMKYRHMYDVGMALSMEEFEKSGNAPQAYNVRTFNTMMNTTKYRDSLEQEIRQESNELALQYMYLHYLMLPQQEQNKMITEKSLRVIPASSPVWGADPALLYVALSAKLAGGKEQYISELINNNPDEHVVATTLFNELLQASTLKDMPRAKEMYKTLTEKYSTHPLAGTAKMYYNPNRKIMEGNPLPPISLTTLDKRKLSNENLKGKYTIIDVWSSMNAASTSNIAALTTANEKYKNKNLQVISISLDIKAADVTAFREKNSMPWIHALAERGYDSDIVKTLEVVSLPRTILVGPDGKILAIDLDLRGEKLEHTLKALIQ